MLNLDRFSQLNASVFWLRFSSAQVGKALTLFFGVASIVVAGLIAWAVLSGPPIVSVSSLNVSNSAPRPRWNWFSGVAAPREETSLEEFAQATINAELLGVVVTEGLSYAVISTSRNSQALYTVGDSIEDNVTLEEIQDDRVIIAQRGSRRQIPLKSLEKGARRTSLLEVGASSPVTNAEGFNLSGLVSANPVRLPGGGTGLKLRGLSEDLTDLADVREDDVVAAVNGRPVGDLLTNPLLWQQFSRQTNIPITIRRGEEEIELFVNAASLSAKILPRIGAGQVK